MPRLEYIYEDTKCARGYVFSGLETRFLRVCRSGDRVWSGDQALAAEVADVRVGVSAVNLLREDQWRKYCS